MVVAEPVDHSVKGARAALAEEWLERNPETPADIDKFYRESRHLGRDLEAWHRTPSRQQWTKIVEHVALNIGAKRVIDIGCGRGDELLALTQSAGLIVDVAGVEPNALLRDFVRSRGICCGPDVANAPIEEADLLLCLDVLEHIPDPEAFLGQVAARARLGCVLIESTATFDCDTPLHLKANRGWHPGHCLEQHGWQLLDQSDRVRVWQRLAVGAEPKSTAVVCAYRTCSIPTMTSLLKLQQAGWRIMPKWGDGLISRARSIIASRWWAETADDVLLMIDDDIVFTPENAEHLVALCRDGHDIVSAVYPVRDAGHLALRGTGATGTLAFGPREQPCEIRYASTGFLAVHRKVLDALMPTLPWCHTNQPWAFKPLFLPMVVEDLDFVGHNYLSEDWAFCERARAAGFKIWLDPTIVLGHLSQVSLNVVNMVDVENALAGDGPDQRAARLPNG